MIIGVTGKIGAGKHTVASFLQERGYFILDVDKIAHTLYLSGSEIWSLFVLEFGNGILNQKGEVERSELAKIVFQNPQKMAKLNSIVHPVLFTKIQAEIKKLLQKKQTKIVLVAALGEELKLRKLVDKILLVRAPFDLKTKWLQKKRGMSLQEIQARDFLQKELNDFDYLIENKGNLLDLKNQLKALSLLYN